MTCLKSRSLFFFKKTGKKKRFPTYDEQKEEKRMKKENLPVVHCTYCNTEKSVSEILEESFRLYLSRILAIMEYSIVQYK